MTSNQEIIRQLDHMHEHQLAVIKEQEAQTVLLRRIFRKVGKIMATAADLTREIAETREAVGTLLAKMQELIDQIAQNSGNQEAVDAAVAELDALQSEIVAVVNPTE